MPHCLVILGTLQFLKYCAPTVLENLVSPVEQYIGEKVQFHFIGSPEFSYKGQAQKDAELINDSFSQAHQTHPWFQTKPVHKPEGKKEYATRVLLRPQSAGRKFIEMVYQRSFGTITLAHPNVYANARKKLKPRYESCLSQVKECNKFSKNVSTYDPSKEVMRVVQDHIASWSILAEFLSGSNCETVAIVRSDFRISNNVTFTRWKDIISGVSDPYGWETISAEKHSVRSDFNVFSRHVFPKLEGVFNRFFRSCPASPALRFPFRFHVRPSLRKFDMTLRFESLMGQVAPHTKYAPPL
ncbi:hypothetical protein CYMTET_38511 [Cymbomonas tetramitiformis]|uniref:Uncharacterized protein n=1 Tax=Cymbomonas tetramitiformis TaxID=36881 RepID=A0AAE0CBU7_9CHLO|nr:hypothetical protein CYMTET_38511 [Cymbomonas tetramitiformis]